MGHRSSDTQAAYRKYRAELGEVCQFCEVDLTNVRVEYPRFLVINNIFPYETWDGERVLEHLLLVPRKHSESLSVADDGAEALVEWAQIVHEYENAGFNIYARSANSSLKTVAHQHTHLIKSRRYR